MSTNLLDNFGNGGIFMFSYQKLRKLIDSRGISFRTLRTECGITSNVATDLNNDRPVTIDKLAIICRYLNVPIEEVVEITLESDD